MIDEGPSMLTMNPGDVGEGARPQVRSATLSLPAWFYQRPLLSHRRERRKSGDASRSMETKKERKGFKLPVVMPSSSAYNLERVRVLG